MRYRIPSYIPVIAHNLARYDTHLFIKELGEHFENIGVIAKNKEGYITFSVEVVVDKYIDRQGVEKEKFMELRFIDSFKFMATSLDLLVKDLVGGGDSRASAGQRLAGFEEYSKSQYKLLTRKGIYPYEYMMSWEKFEETELPPIEAFYSELNMSGVSEDDYQHAQQVWKEFGTRNLGEYHDLYLRMDVVLPENVFEKFRETVLKHYGLDPAHFYTLPGFAWKACLKKTKVRLELLSDPDMLLMFEQRIRGGSTQAVHKHALANNKCVGDQYDPSTDSIYLQYLDTNNLYGWAMSQPLPTGRFRWVDVKPDEIHELAKRAKKGYLLEVDVCYPRDLHNSHNNLPFMCERMEIDKVEKLVPNLRDKKGYVIHIRALDQALNHRLVLERVHRTIEFNQSAWMKPYIDFNTQLRAVATSNFEKDFFKLMNNAVFGKTMENIRKHRNIKLVITEERYLKTVIRPNFKSGTRFDENLMGCERAKIKVKMNKPVCLGQAILDLSKIVMYEFHYDYMKPKIKDLRLRGALSIRAQWPPCLQLCYTDTDSLVYGIKTEDFYVDIADNVPTRFDTSRYLPDRPLPVGLNKKVIGLIKDELGGAIMTEFVGLRPKLYSYRVLNGVETPEALGPRFAENKKCKGIKKCVVKKTLMFEDYKACLFNSNIIYRSQLMFRSMKHEIYIIEVNKIALNRDDDKRISKRDVISTLARGHKSLSWSPILGEAP